MGEKKNSWIRDLLLVPLSVGLVIAVATYFLPKIFSDSRELSYQIEEPIAYLDKASLGTAEVKVNNVAVPEIFAARVRIWNSGSIPLKDLPVLFEFKSNNDNFRILSFNHNTKPSREFGGIENSNSEGGSKRFVYELLNPLDEDSIVFLTTSKAEINVFSKAENLSVKNVPADKSVDFPWYLAALGAMLASIITELFQFMFRRLRRERNDTMHGE